MKRGSSNEVITSVWHCCRAVQCLLHSFLLQERKTLCGKDLKGLTKSPKVPPLRREGHGAVWQAKEKFWVFSANQQQNKEQRVFSTRCACVFKV